MKTKLVYLEDSYKKALEANILEIEVVNEKLIKVILDETIFFAEGGGQPSDQGILVSNDTNFKVKQVRLENGEIKHYIDIVDKLPQKGNCFLEIDWRRRYTNMLVHSAGHIVDWAVSELKLHNDKLIPSKASHSKKPFIGYIGVANNLEKSDVQKRVNKIIENNLNIQTQFVSFEELKERALYTFPNLPKDKPLRIVTLDGYKSVPDGGTLIAKTGEIHSIIIDEIKVEDNETFIYYSIEENKDDKEVASEINSEDSNEISKTIERIKNESKLEINDAQTIQMIEKLEVKYLGRKSELINLLRSLKDLPYDIRAKIGKDSNQLRIAIENMIETKKTQINNQKLELNIQNEWLDVTEPSQKANVGNLHPITQMLWKVTDIFQSMGFEVVEPTEIDNDFNHFTALNIPEGHPARDMWDTFWTEDEKIAIAHTSTMQNRILTSKNPPIRAVVPGRCFRNEATDSSHEHTFYQLEGVYLDKGITLTHLVSTLKTFLERFFEEEIQIKIQPTYFPFVEPALEIMMKRPGYKKTSNGKYDKKEWLEVIPCGPIHPNVLRAANIDPDVYSGFAWGLGLDRLVMVKYGIDDIRHFHGGDLRFLKQF